MWNQNSLSYGVWTPGGIDYIVSPFPEHNCWSGGMGFLKLFCSCCSWGINYLVESRRPLQFGSSQANRSVFNTLSTPPLAAVSRSTLIISLHVLLVMPPFPHHFQVPVICWFPLFSLSQFCPASLVSWATVVNMQCRNIASCTNGAGCIHTEYTRTKHVYIYTYIYRQFSPQVWDSLHSPQLWNPDVVTWVHCFVVMKSNSYWSSDTWKFYI